MKILLLSRYDRSGASSRLRMLNYVPYLEEHGMSVDIAPLFDDVYLKRLYSSNERSICHIVGLYIKRLRTLLSAGRYDLLWIEKELFPALPSVAERVVSRFGIPYVVDYDDAVFHNYDRHSNSVMRHVLGNNIDRVMRSAKMVTTGNRYLAERAYNAGAKGVEIIPTVVDIEKYQISDDRQNEVFTIGWIGTPCTFEYLEMIRPALERICSDRKVRLVLVGSGPRIMRNIDAEILEWSEDAEAGQIAGFDVGIMPLADNEWERGKCGYKLIQYMAAGKPVIASPVGVNGEIVEHGRNGYLASDNEEWLEALNELIKDRDHAKKMGAIGRAKVESSYCLDVTAPVLYDILLDAVKGRHDSLQGGQ